MRRRHLLVATGSALIGAGCVGKADRVDGSSPSSSDASPTSTTTDFTCKRYDMHIGNSTATPVTVSFTVMDMGSRYARGSSTRTKGPTPVTDTPVEAFSDTFQLGPDDSENQTQRYEDLPTGNGGFQRLQISVEDGPTGTFNWNPPLSSTETLGATIGAETIRFSVSEVDLPPQC